MSFISAGQRDYSGLAAGQADAFGRQRVSEPHTIFDSKQLNDAQTLFWDDQEVSGGSTTSSHSGNRASTDIGVGATTAGNRVRQTFMRFNYQPGKALAHGEPVLTPMGWVPIEGVSVGDTVFDGFGKETEVIGVYPQGERECYRVTFDDGTWVDCDGEHLWKTIGRQNSQKGKPRVLTVNQMLAEYGEEPPQFARWRIPAAPVLECDEREVPIDAYTIGAILGDGHINKKTGHVVFTSADEELVDDLEFESTKYERRDYSYGLYGSGEVMRGLGLAGSKSTTKWVPDEYKYNSPEVRLACLQGLMDTDGDVDKRCGTASFTSCSVRLANDVAYLVRSLGGQAKIKPRQTHCTYKGEKVAGAKSYRVTVIMPQCPFRLERKAIHWKPRTRISYDRYIHTIKPIGTRQATCIRVASEDHTFLTRNNVVTHNSQLIFITFVMDKTGGGTGINRYVGLFDDENGLFLQDDEGSLYICRRTYATGSAVDTRVIQGSWNIDTMDGNGQSGVTLDMTKSQIMVIDYEWLGVGRARLGFVVDGAIYYAHEFLNTNSLDVVYMSTPNLPIRYEIDNDATGAASSMECICSTVISEGGQEDLGVLQYESTDGTHLDANAADTLYAVIGLRLKAAYLDTTIKLISGSMISETNDDFEWVLMWNPTVAGTFTYVDKTGSALQTVLGVTANTVTGGTAMTGGFVKSSAAVNQALGNALRLGSTISGTPDEIVLCVRPLSANADIQGSITWREIS